MQDDSTKDTRDLHEVLFKALADLRNAYVQDEHGDLLSTTVLLDPRGHIVAKWVRGSKSDREGREIVQTANDIAHLPSNRSQNG